MLLNFANKAIYGWKFLNYHKTNLFFELLILVMVYLKKNKNCYSNLIHPLVTKITIISNLLLYYYILYRDGIGLGLMISS